MYQIELKAKAQKAIAKQPKKIQKQLISQIEKLKTDPRPANCKQLDNQLQIYRVRSGDFRIIYQIQDNKLIIIVAEVGDRKDIERTYRNLSDFLRRFEHPN